MISKSSLAIILSQIKGFSKPKLKLEQYPTDSEVAATVLWNAFLKGWIKDKRIIDLGAGSGILGIGALLLGAKKAIFVEKDAEAFATLKENVKVLKLEKRSILKLKPIEEVHEIGDTVIQNPPFGTKSKAMDIKFLNKAFEIAPRVISFHKTSTLEYVKKKCNQQGFEIIEEMHFLFPLKNTFKFHHKPIHRIKVSALFLTKTI